MTQHLDAQEAHARFAQLLDEIHETGQTVVVERSGLPIAVILPFAAYQQLTSGTALPDEIRQDIRRRMPYLFADDSQDALPPD